MLFRSSFVQLNENNIQLILIINIFIICLFFFLIIRKLVVFLYKSREISGVRTNLNFIKYFIFVTAVPSIFVAVFSLMLFNLGIEKWFDKKVNEDFNVNVFDNDPEKLPESEEELKLHMQLTYKQNVELAEEQALNVLMKGNDYDLKIGRAHV